MIVPASSTATSRSSSTPPVSVSTSTRATWQPNGNVGTPWNSCAAFSTSSFPSAAARSASSGQEKPRCGAPAISKRPVAVSSLTSLRAHLEIVGRELARRRDDVVGGKPRGGAAELRRLRAVRAGALRDLVGVALENRDRLDGDAEAVRDDLRERRLVALPVREGSGSNRRAAVLGDLDLRRTPSPRPGS